MTLPESRSIINAWYKEQFICERRFPGLKVFVGLPTRTEAYILLAF